MRNLNRNLTAGIASGVLLIAARIEIDPTNPNRIYFAGNIPGRMGFVEVLPQ